MSESPSTAAPPASRAARVLGGVALGLIVAVALASALYGIAGPLAWGHHGHHAGNHGNDAKHLLRNGTMVQQWDPGYNAVQGRYYLHHPILLHHYVAAAILILGPHVWALRAVPAFFTLLIALAVFWVGRRAWGLGPGLMGAAVFVLLPMVASFNILPDHQHPAAFYTVAAFYLYLRWLETGERYHIALSLAAFFMVAFTDWTPYLITLFFGLYLVGHAIAVRRRRELFGILGVVLAFAIPLATHFTLVKLLGAEADMQESFTQRSGGPTPLRIAEMMFDNQLRMYTRPVVWLTGVWLVTVIVRAPFGALRRWHVIPLAFLAAQTIYIFLFRQGVYVHIYRTYYAGIVYAFAAADLLGLLLAALRAVGGARLWRGLPATVATVAALSLLALEARAGYPIYLESRAKAGSIGHQGYNPDLERLVFGRFVNDISTPQDLVLVHSSFRARYEFHWYLDRDVKPTSTFGEPPPRRPPRTLAALGRFGRGHAKAPAPEPPPPAAAPARGKLLIAVDALNRGPALALLRAHPCYRLGPFVVFDLRHDGPRYRSYRMVGVRPRGLLERFLGGPHERHWRLQRDLDDEWRVVMANQLPVEDRPPPRAPKGKDRNAWVRYAQVLAALGRPAEARAARTRALDTLAPDRPAVPMGDGIVLDAAVWRSGSPFHVMLHTTAAPAQQHELVLALDRVGPAPPSRLPAVDLRPPPAAPRPTILADALRPPPPPVLRRFERPLQPPAPGWPVEHTLLELWPVTAAPGLYRAWLSLLPAPAAAPPELDLGLVEVR